MEEVAIKVGNVSKAFKLPHEKQSSIKNIFLNLFRGHRTYERQRVLEDVSLDIKKGEFFGIVGRNGSGKSTLLKLLAGIYAPNKGTVEVYGRLTPFIELGVGFNPELSGRENVYLNGALLGFGTKEVDEMYAEIVEFAELEKFMDQKLKNYSSGMQVRLAFSIAIRARSDILLIDEVLAVGDEAFQRKCVDIFELYKAQKQTVILVTHDMEAVKKFCSRAMLVDSGKIVDVGNPYTIAEKYSLLNQEAINDEVSKNNKRSEKLEGLGAIIAGTGNKKKNGFKFGEKMVVEVDWSKLDAEQIESIGVHIFKLSGEHLTGINSRTGALSNSWKLKGKIAIEFELNILPGKYRILVEAFDHHGKIVDSIHDGLHFTVGNHKMEWSGLVELPHKWHELSGAEQ